MTKLTWKSVLALTASAAMLSAYNTAPAFAQDDTGVEDEIIIIGSRSNTARSSSDTIAPVDVISGDDFAASGLTDVSDLLRASVPSYNVNTQPISDAATLVRPANLRGLSPDNTLVLLNGKRRHRAAVISFLGGGIADGAQGPDVSVFPTLALKQVQVLRDGASSQYGSDAIAGVMNFVLKDDAEGGSIMARYGSTYEGDGDNLMLGVNKGFALGDQGFVNVTAEYRQADGTFRSIQRTDAANLIAAGNTAVGSINVNTVTDEFVQYWGQPDVKDDLKLFVNSALEVGDNTEVYLFGNYAEREAEGGFFFRNPTNRGGVYAGPQYNVNTGNVVAFDQASGNYYDTGRQTTGVAPLPYPGAGIVAVADLRDSVLVGDLDGDVAGGSCPLYVPLTAAGADTASSQFAALGAPGDNCFSFIEAIPGGFTPRFGGQLTDVSVVGGIRGEISVGNGLGYDVSFSYGENEADYFINNTVNASLGPRPDGTIQRNFNPGAYIQTEMNFNADFTYGIPVDSFAGDVSLAAGFEWREETFEVVAGEPNSFTNPNQLTAQQANLLAQGFSPNSNGFGGFTTGSAGSNSQSNIALYADVEAPVSEQLTVLGAVRWEDFDVFGDTLNYKVGARYEVSDMLALRGTYSTGFHAPTAGQANVTNVSTVLTGGALVDRGTLPVSSTAAQLVNPGASIDAEKAKNLSLGAVIDVLGGELTVDLFNIEVEDRIAQSDDFDFLGTLQSLATANSVTVTGTQNTFNFLQALDAANVLNASDFAGFEGLTTFRTFANDFDTRTRGVDVVFDRNIDLGSGTSKLLMVGNYTDTKVTNQGGLGATRVQQLEENLPKFRGSATFMHDTNDIFSGFVRANYYGKFYEAHLDDGTLPINAGAEFTIDAEISAEVREGITLSVGAENLLDNYPDRNPWDFIVGAAYPVTSPFGFSGGQYYGRLRIDW